MMPAEQRSGQSSWTTEPTDPPPPSGLLDHVLEATDEGSAPAWLPAAREFIRSQPGPVTASAAAGVVSLALADWFRATNPDLKTRQELCLRIADTLLSHPSAGIRFLDWWSRMGQP